MSETCTVRPELIEFDKTNAANNQFLTIVAHPEGFKFTATEQTTNDIGNILDPTYITYDNANLASLWANDISIDTAIVTHIKDVEDIIMNDAGDIEMNNSNMSNVGTFTTNPTSTEDYIVISSNVIDMRLGTIDHIETMKLGGNNRIGTEMSIINDEITFGSVDGKIDMNEGNIVSVKLLELATDSTIDLNGGVITNIATQNMSEDGVINFNNGGLLNMTSANCQANIGEITIEDAHIYNANTDAETGVTIELTNFFGNVISTAEINAIDDKLLVFDATFTSDTIEIANINVDHIYPANLDGTDTLYLHALNDGTVDVSGHRITNLRYPVAGLDAANKNYVNEAVSQNIQGLKPKKACDYAIFGNQWGSSEPGTTAGNYTNYRGFGRTINELKAKRASNLAIPGATLANRDDGMDDLPYFLTMKSSYDPNIGDTSMLTLYCGGGDTSNIVFSEELLHDVDVLFNEAAVTEANELIPNIARKRILINGLNMVNYRPNSEDTTKDYKGDDNDETYLPNDANIAGVNGIWEIVNQTALMVGTKLHNTIRMVRAQDMNQDKEMMNNAYSYLMNAGSSANEGGNALPEDAALKNFGYVVDNKDPITIVNGLTMKNDVVGGDVNGHVVTELTWVRFNQVNFELDFMNASFQRREEFGSGDVNTTFGKGGLMMRSTAGIEGEKQVMVQSDKLKYDVDGHVMSLTGNIDMLPSGGDVSSINCFTDAMGTYGTLSLNGVDVTNTGGEASITLSGDITCSTVTCESDKTLKKNITPQLNCLEMIHLLEPVTYNWNKDVSCESLEYGFIAQQVQEIFPSLVKTNMESGILSVDYMKITSMLSGAVQELRKELVDMKSKL
jgi:hypothetical protein